jgi:hypothetical protein
MLLDLLCPEAREQVRALQERGWFLRARGESPAGDDRAWLVRLQDSTDPFYEAGLNLPFNRHDHYQGDHRCGVESPSYGDYTLLVFTRADHEARLRDYLLEMGFSSLRAQEIISEYRLGTTLVLDLNTRGIRRR